MQTHFAETPLDALPWLSHSGAAAPPVPHRGAGIANDVRHAGLAAIAAGLLASAWFLTGGFTAQADLGVPRLSPAPSAPTPPSSERAILQRDDASAAAELGAAEVDMPGLSPRAPAIDKARSAAPARAKPAARARPSGARTLPAADPSTTADEALASGAASPMIEEPLPATESPVAAATLRQFKSAVREAKDAARDVIRLGERRRPGRDATAAEQTADRLRQQNAEAARTYLTYLDTLARSMKGTTSETVAQQSLAKARQTLGYLSTMEADSKASLR